MITRTSNIVYIDFKLISMIDFVFMLRNRTSSELVSGLPNNFVRLRYNGDQNQAVKHMLANDSIQWGLTGEYAKFLSKKNRIKKVIDLLSFSELYLTDKAITTIFGYGADLYLKNADLYLKN